MSEWKDRLNNSIYDNFYCPRWYSIDGLINSFKKFKIKRRTKKLSKL